MTRVQRSALLPYSASKIYQMVNDVDAYPEFLPWCVNCETNFVSEAEKHATMHFAKRGIKASVTTRNELFKDEKIIMHLLKGPFKHLLGEWQFTSIDEQSCKVELEMQFTFSNRLYEMSFGPIFNQVANKLVTLFSERAKFLYG